LTSQAELTIITSQALTLIEEVISWSNANAVITSLSQNHILGEFIVQGNARGRTSEGAIIQAGKVGGPFAPTDTLKSILGGMKKECATKENLNTGLLWKGILAEVLSRVSKYTTKTTSAMIIELKTLNSLLSQVIQGYTTQGEIAQSGIELNVDIVESILTSVLIKSLSQREVTVQKTALIDSLINQGAGQNVSIAATLSSGAANQSQENIAPKNAIGTTVVLVAMKPLDEKTYLDQALANRKGITWLDSVRIPFAGDGDKTIVPQPATDSPTGKTYGFKTGVGRSGEIYYPPSAGRFPANLLVSDDVLNDGRGSKGQAGAVTRKEPSNFKPGLTHGDYSGVGEPMLPRGDSGSFSRYFSLDAWWEERVTKLPEQARRTFPFLLVPKPSKREKNAGCEGLDRTEHVCYNETTPLEEMEVSIWEDMGLNQNTQAGSDTRQRRAIIASAFGTLPPKVADLCSLMYINGRRPTGRFLRVLLYTTSTATNKITSSKIYSLLHTWSIKDSMGDVNCETAFGGNPAVSVKNSSQSQKTHGISQKKGGLSTGGAESVTSALSLIKNVLEELEQECNQPPPGHPTVKPLQLASWLVTLGSREGDVVLDLFAGSGTFPYACVLQGRRSLGFDNDPSSIEIARSRLAHARDEMGLFAFTP
jgi:hypothetical protein